MYRNLKRPSVIVWDVVSIICYEGRTNIAPSER